ncbi:uncharacterized protein LOC126994828 [Eriocheir sinensis]|uniref:uncharacterized protein LOC126994828 n=1 Tax=Eriocheir sinensis TaxID=95602 RepID=UPI0021C90561|nr:uncharacterized protein LOC126994828 [Eriocheir sinensis]
MEYTGPATLTQLEMDLALSDDDESMAHVNAERHWPPLDHHQAAATSSTPTSPSQSHAPLTAVANKRRVDSSSDTSTDSLNPPALKTLKHNEMHPAHQSPTLLSPAGQPSPSDTREAAAALPPAKGPPHPSLGPLTPSSLPPPPPSTPAPVQPAFAPRADYAKLVFPGNPSVETKLRWLSELNKVFQLDRCLAEVKMSAVTSRFVYISRKREDIIGRVVAGEFLSLKLDMQDSPERPRKYPSYLVTRYPVGVAPSLAKELIGVHSTRRFHVNGEPINRIVATWSLPSPPPSSVEFSFLPFLPACELRRLENDKPTCYRCWGIGHISRYCSSSKKCAWCAQAHDTRTCSHSAPPPPPSSASSATNESPMQSVPDTAHWECPRCHEKGVNVWHGCAKRRVSPASPPAPPPPLVRSAPAAATSASASTAHHAQVAALRDAVSSLTSKVNSVTARIDSLESRLDELATKFTAAEAKLDTLVDAHTSLIANVTSLTERVGTLVDTVERLTDEKAQPPPPSRGAQRSAARLTTPTIHGSRHPKSRPQ